MAVPRRILPVIVLSQFAGTSLWFAGNAVLPDIQSGWALPPTAVATVTSAVQLGFVAGTLVFALLMVADRWPPARVFLACSVLAAGCNAAIALLDGQFAVLVALRFAVGFLLAGIYPVGMKIAASWYRDGLGAALGVLVGALVLGTALPHGLRALAGNGAVPAWQAVLLGVSVLAALGGVATFLLVPDKRQGTGVPIDVRALRAVVAEPRLRASVFGYFGHMWELYTLYALMPAIVAMRFGGTDISALTFWAISAGFIGCAAGGILSRRVGSERVAATQLAVSGMCCLIAPWMLAAPTPVFVAWLLVWGLTVVGDSPQFSALTARNAPPAAVGSVLTLTNCVGFAISVVSIELFVRLNQVVPLALLLPWLAVGPVLGLIAFRPLLGLRP